MATVKMLIPLVVPQQAPENAGTGASSPLDLSVVSELAGLRLLVVEDQADARELIQRVLEDSGAEVLTAANAADALEMVRSERPDILVSDIGMPEGDGFDLLRSVRALGAEHGGNIPAIAVTAFARSEDRTRALRAGFLVHVAKPLDPAELVATVASVAGRLSDRSVESISGDS
jgi:CheY-like chemotaxis protein